MPNSSGRVPRFSNFGPCEYLQTSEAFREHSIFDQCALLLQTSSSWEGPSLGFLTCVLSTCLYLRGCWLHSASSGHVCADWHSNSCCGMLSPSLFHSKDSSKPCLSDPILGVWAQCYWLSTCQFGNSTYFQSCFLRSS